jgi:hypothetical protein
MTTSGLALAAVLAVVVVLVVARPFLRVPGRGEPADGLPGEEQLERIRLAEERDRALSALKELEFDHRTGKISDADYRELVAPLRRQAAEALHGLDPPRKEAQPKREDVRA